MLQERTVRYKTYVKTALVEAFRGVFSNHKDELLSGTKVTLDYPRNDSEFPAVIVRFIEKDIQNMGVGHEEHIQLDGPNGKPLEPFGGVFTFRHYMYHADIEFAILALTSKDRDLISDTIVQTITMGKLEAYTNRFFERIYPNEQEAKYPDSIWHFININADQVKPGYETQEQTPWMSEDDLVYRTSSKVATMGEFYSVPPDLPKGFVTDVLLFPYIGGLEEIPQGESGEDALWEPPAEE